METQPGVENEVRSLPMLLVWQNEIRGKTHIYVSRGTQELVITLARSDWEKIQVNGVHESIQRGQEFLKELIGPKPELEFPRYGTRNVLTYEVSYELQDKTARLWNDGFIKLTQQMMGSDLTLRRLGSDELAAMIGVANYLESSFDAL